MKSVHPTQYQKARASLATKYLDASLRKEIHESLQQHSGVITLFGGVSP